MVDDGDDETKKDLEESDHGLINALCQHLRRGTEEDYENPQDRQFPSRDSNWAPHQLKSTALLLHHPAEL